MIDPVSATMLALTSHSPVALGMVFLAGALTSLGPCVAPRYVAIAAIVGGTRRPTTSIVAFVLGLIGAFIAVGFAAGTIGALWQCSTAIYLALAIGLVAGGWIMLANATPARATESECTHVEKPSTQPRSLGAIFLLGAGSALVVSPCCTPVVAAVVATSTAIGNPVTGVILLTAYAAGHALPLLFAGHMSALAGRIFPKRIVGEAPAIVGAALLFALGLYYGVLA